MFRKLADKFNRFMYGRYGADQLYYALVIAFLLFAVLANIFHFAPLLILAYAAMIWAFVRYFSKNIYKRREENRKWLSVWQKIKNFFTLQRDKVRDRKICRYRKCKYCRSILRLPIKKGKHSVKCPRCTKSFDVNIWI